MKNHHTLIKHCYFIFFCLLLSISSYAFAAGTPAGSVISNTATLSYDVAGVTQPALNSNTVNTIVDNKIDLTVTEANASFTGVSAGQFAAVTQFSVTNLGNATQDYALAAANLPVGPPNVFGSPDTFDATACVARVESGANAGYQAAEDIGTFVDELAPDTSKAVYLVCNIPVGQVVNDQATVSLTATSATGGSAGAQGAPVIETAGAENATAIDIVFADANSLPNVNGTDPGQAARDALATAKSAYRVGFSLIINKSATCSPAPADCSQAKTGTVITYQLLANLTGVGTATGLVVSDSMPSDVTYVANSTTVGGVPKTDLADADNAQFSANTVTVILGSPTAPATFTITFKATIN